MKRGRKQKLFFLVAICLALAVNSCGKNQITGFIQEAFSETVRCGITDKILTFTNTASESLVIEGIGIAGGTNGEGNFSLQGLQVGSEAEIEPLSSGGIGEATVPAGLQYALRVRYSPRSTTTEAEPHSAIIDMVMRAPEEGIIQIQVFGTSQGEGDCPELSEGEAVGLDGDVTLTITRLIAALNAIQEPLSSDDGVRPFVDVPLSATLDADAGEIDFPKFEEADNFILASPDPDRSPTLFNLIFGDTIIVSRSAVTGIYDAETGSLELPPMKIDLKVTDPSGEIQITTTKLTTGTVPFPDRGLSVPTVINAGIPVTTANELLGSPIDPETGAVRLVGIADIDDVIGTSSQLRTGKGNKMAVLIEAIILCSNGTTNCN